MTGAHAIAPTEPGTPVFRRWAAAEERRLAALTIHACRTPARAYDAGTGAGRAVTTLLGRHTA